MVDFSEILFEEQTKKTLAVLAKMKMDLDEYAKKDNAIPSIIQQREKTILILFEYINKIVPARIAEIESTKHTQFQAGYNEGFSTAESKYVYKPDPFLQREDFRLMHNNERKDIWFDHY